MLKTNCKKILNRIKELSTVPKKTLGELKTSKKSQKFISTYAYTNIFAVD